jgi:hypothetical protein
MGVMFKARRGHVAGLVDATVRRRRGAVFECRTAAKQRHTGLNLHDFRWSHALYAGRQI